MLKRYLHTVVLCLCLFNSTLVSAQLQPVLEIEILGSDNVCVNSTTTYSLPFRTGNYTWTLSSNGNLSTVNGTSADIYWTTPGITQLTVAGIAPSGVGISGTITIYVHELPDPFITANKIVGCEIFNDPDNPGELFENGNCTKTCRASVVTYTPHGTTGSTYSWSVSGGTFTTSGNNCIVTWSNKLDHGSISVTETTSAGCSVTKTYCIELIPKPEALFTLTQQLMNTHVACLQQGIIFFDQSTGGVSPIVSWYWDFGDGSTYSSSTSTNPTHSYLKAGGYIVTLTVKNSCNCTDTYTFDINITNEAGINIICPGVVCENQISTYHFNEDCDQFDWHVTGGTIQSTQGHAVNIVWDQVGDDGFGYLDLTTDCKGTCAGTTTIKVPVIRPNIPILGSPRVVCTNKQYLYRLPAWPGTKFTWSLVNPPAGTTIIPTDQPNEIVVNTGSQLGTFILKCTYHSSIADCGGETFSEITVQPHATISGPVKACQNSSVTYTGSGFTGTWRWKIKKPNGSVVNSAFNVTSFNTGSLTLPGVYTIEVEFGSFCPPEPVILTVQAKPAQVDRLTGPTVVCPGAIYMYYAGNPLAGTTYAWSVVGGSISGSASGPEAAITFSGAGPYSVNVWRVNKEDPNCSSIVKSLSVTKEDINLTINGPIAVCANTRSIGLYSVNYTRGESYEWQIDPQEAGSVSSGNGTPNINIIWNNTSGPALAHLKVTVKKCGQPYVKTMDVNINGLTDVHLTGDPTVCRGATYVFSHDAPSGSSFVVDFGNGVTETYTNYPYSNFSYTYPNIPLTSDVTYTIKVTVTSSQFCTNPVVVTKSVIVKPAPLVAISPAGVITECSAGFSHTLIASLQSGYIAATSLTWSLPSGTLSPCDPTITACNTQVATDYGSYFVQATAANGCSASSNIVSINHCDVIDCDINPLPQLSIDVNTNSCGQLQLTGNNSSGGYNQFWILPGSMQNIAYPSTTSLSSTVTGNMDKAGLYTFYYKVVYNNVNSVACTTSVSKSVLVPVVANLQYTAACASGGYNVTLLDHSSAYPGTQITQYDFYINSTLYQSGSGLTYAHSAVLSPGTYTIKLVIHYNSGATCQVEKTLVLAPLPVADFTFTMNNSCEGVPVIFTNQSANYTSSFWDFGDISSNTLNDVEKVFTAALSSYNVVLTVSNSSGCTSFMQKTVNIVSNSLIGNNSLQAAPNPVCAPFTSTLVYTGTGIPTQYAWSNNGINFFTGPANTMTVSRAGYYWVKVSNGAKCSYTSGPIAVVVKSIPDPVIIGSHTQCEDKQIVLNGFVGTDVEYTWTRDLATIVTYDPVLHETLPPGTYHYILGVNIPGTTCYKYADFDVTVNPLPLPPTITANINNCEVSLSASTGVPGTYNWSNGAQGSNISADIGGPYKVWFTDAVGCESSNETIVPKDPKGYLWVFPEGCYTRCLPPSGEIVIDGPIIPFDAWEWWQNSGTINSGTYSLVDPLHISSSGYYNLLLNNRSCTAISGNLDITINEDCNYEECAQLTVTNKDSKSNGCTIDLNLEFGNTMSTGYTFSIMSDVPGSITPAGGVIPAGTSSQSFKWIASPGHVGNGNIFFTIKIYLPGSRVCYKTVSMEYNCGVLARKASPGSKSSKSIKLNNLELAPAILKVAPNPANTFANVSYQVAEKKGSKYSLDIYSMVGIKVLSVSLRETFGTTKVNTAAWPAGLYNLVLKQDGITVRTNRLVVSR
jgi:PKD repeat protein